MKIMVFDTETTSLEKPFCYNIGIVVYDTESEKILLTKEWVVSQVWYNLPLFASAYYADKRPIYVNRLRGRTIYLDKFGYVMQRIKRIIEQYNVTVCYAYNSPFDDMVMRFNSDWYKCVNAFEVLPIFDIRGYVHKKIAFTKEYQNFCDEHKLYTESGNYSTNAENVYKFISGQVDFIEEHTALNDSLIELDILKYCIDKNCEWNTEYKVYSSIPKKEIKPLTINDKRNDNIYELEYEKMRFSKNKTVLTLT